MSKNLRWYFGLIAFGLTSVLAVILLLKFLDINEIESKPIIKVVRYTLTVRNTTNQMIRDSKVDVFAPVQETSWQRVVDMNTSHQHKLTKDSIGNQTLSFTLSLHPYAVEIISVQASIAIYSNALAVEVDDPRIFIKSEKYIEAEDSLIKEKALELKRGSLEETARAIYDFVVTHVQETGYRRENRGALYALKEKNGDCTEFAFLFVALSRANGIPARPVGGFYLADNRAIIKGQNYHNWAEFYDGKKWRISDPLLKHFDESSENYLNFRILQEAAAITSDNTQRFLSFDDRLELKVN